MRARAIVLASTVTLAAAVACFDDGITEPEIPITFTGALHVVNGKPVPPNARVLVLWTVSESTTDYEYVFGSGKMNDDGTFSITFDQAPPVGALNMNQVGVGLVILTTDQSLAQGQVPENYGFPGLIGMSEEFSIIYTQNLTGTLAVDWPSRFIGYGLGEVERNTNGLDTFKVVARDALRVVVDDFANLTPPNWT